MTRQAFRINPALDPEGLACEFARAGRIHIPNFLVAEDAERLLDHLKAAEEDWRLVINAGEKLFELDRRTQGEMDEAQREALDQAVNAQARAGFQFRYETIRVPDAEAERCARGSVLDDFARFLSDEPALDFLRRVIGADTVSYADAQATAYGPGHFLTSHDDDVAGKNRKAAYVMNLSRDWSADWGGLLVFHEPGEARAEALVPSFNALNLFAVPQLHGVSMVAPWVPRRRYSITGWLRGGRKP